MAEERNIVRLFGTDISGDKTLKDGLRSLTGVNFSTSKAILEKAGLDPDKRAETVTDEELENIKNVIEENELPRHLLNRRRDKDEGGDKMIVSSDLEIQKRQDIEDMKKLGTYRGIRHRRGLPVRGQQTQASFRGQSSVGVSRERIQQQEGGEE